jgi:hypothetical protein
MQDETTNPAEIPRERLRRAEAAAYARRRLGQSVKVNTLRSWPIPYRQVGRDAVYEITDLDRFIDARLAAAPVRRAPAPAAAGREPDFAVVYESRRRLLIPNVGEDEGRLRALEHTINVCRRHHSVDVETAKAIVTNAIKRGPAP